MDVKRLVGSAAVVLLVVAVAAHLVPRDGAAQAGTLARASIAALQASSGAASLHAYDTDDAGTWHLLYSEVEWSEEAERRWRRAGGGAWRQVVTVRVPYSDWPASSTRVEYWASELPQARLEPLAISPGFVTFTVATDAADRIEAGRRYRTHLFVRSRSNLDGRKWYYTEQVGRRGSWRTRPAADPSATFHWGPTRTGRAGWCAKCVIEWRVSCADARRYPGCGGVWVPGGLHGLQNR